MNEQHTNARYAIVRRSDGAIIDTYATEKEAFAHRAANERVERVQWDSVLGAWFVSMEDESASVAFDWSNNHVVMEYAMRFRTTDEQGGRWGEWQEWKTSPITDPDAFLAPFRAELENGLDEITIAAGIDHLRDAGKDDAPNIIDGFVIYVGNFGMVWRKRSVYPGLYDNVQRLRDYIRNYPSDADTLPRSAVEDALSMILTHDRGERDNLAPDGHCRHGVYVGGCGVDWMCGACENGAE